MILSHTFVNKGCATFLFWFGAKSSVNSVPQKVLFCCYHTAYVSCFNDQSSQVRFELTNGAENITDRHGEQSRHWSPQGFGKREQGFIINFPEHLLASPGSLHGFMGSQESLPPWSPASQSWDGRWGHSKRLRGVREGEIHLARGKIDLFLSLWEKVKYLITDSTKLEYISRFLQGLPISCKLCFVLQFKVQPIQFRNLFQDFFVP